MGTGSIAGVATALTLGGPGAVFWMWISALLAMMTGCGEKLLAVKYQRPAPGGGLQGGPMFYLRDGVGSPLLAGWFALACLPATLAGGNLVQSSSIALSLEAAFGLERVWAGVVTTLLAGLVMVGGIGRIARVSSALVPAMALLYLGSGALVLAGSWRAIPEAVELIFTCALSPSAALGGGAGWTVASALRYGVARGVFTNEAGLGSAPIAHAAAETDSPVKQGFWGMFEVFADTFVTCTLTTLVILTTGMWDSGLDGAALTTAAFDTVLGRWGSGFIAISVLFFAVSSMLGWCFYGESAMAYLSRGRQGPVFWYRVVFLVLIMVGATVELRPVWQLSDTLNGLMAVPNLLALLLLSPQVFRLTREHFAPIKKGAKRRRETGTRRR